MSYHNLKPIFRLISALIPAQKRHVDIKRNNSCKQINIWPGLFSVIASTIIINIIPILSIIKNKQRKYYHISQKNIPEIFEL
jgi:hypothetical protein